MRTLALAGLLACLTIGSPLGGGYSFVVLNHSAVHSLVRVGADGNYIATIANGFEGVSLTRDAGGDYIVANVFGLLRVTHSGQVITIASAPSGSQWMKVVQARDGAYIVADNKQHALWSVSADGNSIVKIANYPVSNAHELDDTSLALDTQGNYMLLDGTHSSVRFFRITPAGAVAEITLSKSFPAAGALISDGAAGYLAKAGHGDAIIRIDPAGAVTELVKFNPPWVSIPGIVHNPVTGEILALDTRNQRIVRVGMDGRASVAFSVSSPYIRYPLAILIELGQE